MSRSVAREVAMKLVYSRRLGGDDTPDAVLEKSEIKEPLDLADETFSLELADGVEATLGEVDALIAENTVDWSIDRISRVDLAILRVAVYEMLYREDVPTGASINEAVELAKRFGGERSYSFVNGILGTIAKTLPEKAE